MGRNTTTPDPQQLSRFSVGEIQDFSGVPNFLDAGTSKWLRSNTFTASSNLSTATKASLAAAGTAAANTVVLQSALSNSFNSSGYSVTMPIQRIPGSNVSVVPACFITTTAVGVGVITSAGMQTVPTGQVSQTTNNTGAGVNVTVASDDTTIFAYTNNAAATVIARSTTNGTTWTEETVTGLPTFAFTTDTRSFATNSTTSATVASPYGWKRQRQSSSFNFAVFWCGARFLLIGHDATNYMATLSTNGYDFDGDNTTDVIDGSVARTADMQFYRNGNNCYLQIGTGAKRFSTDGGVTWAAATFAASPNPNSYYLQYNQSDPAKLLIRNGNGGDTTAYYSADSGQTWSASRTLPLNSANGGLYYRGSTLVVTNASNATSVSTDDGATWTSSTFPIGVLSTNTKVFADANRWYLGIDGNAQLLTSTDGVSWVIRTLPEVFSLASVATDGNMGIVPFDSNIVVLTGYSNVSGLNQTFFTQDGGATWTGCRLSTNNISGWFAGNAFTTPDGGGIGFIHANLGLTGGNNTNIFKADVVQGGSFYRTGSTTIAPSRTNALAFVRVE